MQKIALSLWYDTHAEQAINFYTAAFEDSKITGLQHYPESGLPDFMQAMAGKVLTGTFELHGQRFLANDGGPLFKFNPSISLFVNCETESEIDALWATLSQGGKVLMEFQPYPFSPKFGWLEDQYGLSWQLSLAPRPQMITPFLMFVGDQFGRADEAIKLYTALFKDSWIDYIRYADTGDHPDRKIVEYSVFQLNGQDFMAIDSAENHAFTFNEAVSIYVECDSQAEIDHFWYALSAHPEAEQCGWLKDKFGVSWQIVPKVLGDLMQDPDPVKSKRVIDAMLQMKKLDIAGLQRAYAGDS